MMASLRPKCTYWEKCYRTNANHRRQFRHPEPKPMEDDDVSEPEIEQPNEASSSTASTSSEKKSPTKKHSTNRKRKRLNDSVVISSDSEEEKTEEKTKKKKTVCSAVPDTSNLSEKQRRIVWSKHLFSIYGMKMPTDFYDFYDFVLELDPDNPCSSLETFLPGANLVGPFEVIRGDFDEQSILSIHLHWRYYFDPPEFMTILVNEKSGLHFGYFRDDPSELPCCIASNGGNDDYVFQPVGGNLFEMISFMMEQQTKNRKFVSTNSSKSAVKLFEKHAKMNKYSLEKKTFLKRFKSRKKNVVCTTFHKLGMVVPFEDDYGYRPIPQSDRELKKILKRMNSQKESGEEVNGDELDQTLTYISYADDEGDPGMGLQLGLNLFCSFPMFEKEALRLMSQAYSFLNRVAFKKIVDIHIRHRRRMEISQLS
uniref:Histone PARylation factor 1-like n=1 Tax=Hirondellea gigas TaxID=1518452 RepID=A0A6A7GBI9_9CRUS